MYYRTYLITNENYDNKNMEENIMSAVYKIYRVNQPYNDPTINVSMNIGFNNFKPDDKCTAIMYICNLINKHCKNKNLNVWYRSITGAALYSVLNSITILKDYDNTNFSKDDFTRIIDNISYNILAIIDPLGFYNNDTTISNDSLEQVYTIVDMFKSDELLSNNNAEYIKNRAYIDLEFINKFKNNTQKE